MASKAELLKQATKLNKEKKYKEVIELLTDELLAGFNNADLYNEKAKACEAEEKLDECLMLLDKVIKIDPKNSNAYNFKANIWYKKKNYDQAIDDYTKAIKARPDFAIAYYNRANALLTKDENDEAIDDYTKAIDLGYSNALAYYGRGLAWYNKKEYDKAIEDNNRSIQLDDCYADAYLNRGLAWYYKKEYDKALEDDNKVIQLNPDYAYPYNNRGLIFLQKKEYAKAIIDFEKAIQLNPTYANGFRNLGSVYVETGEFDKAIASYETAIELDKSFTWLKSDIDELKAKTQKIDEIKVEANNKVETSLYFLVRTIDALNISDIDKKLLKDIGNTFLQTINDIRDYSFSENNEPVVHYTKLKVADIIVNQEKDPRLRYYNVVYMNDPEEGETLFDCLNDKEIEDCFKSGMEVQDNNIYLGSFLPAIDKDKKNNHEDELVMWRTYGKDENRNDAMGCSIVIMPDFFGKDKQYLHSDMYDSRKENMEPGKQVSNQALYSVLYFDKRDNKVLDLKNKNLDTLITGLKSATKTFISQKKITSSFEKDKAIDKIVYRFLTEIRYLFKSADYAFENELRVIQYASPNSSQKENLVKVDDNGGQWLPRRLYIESNKSVREHICRIYLGPKVANPQTWMYLETVMKLKGNNKFQLKKSECRFQ